MQTLRKHKVGGFTLIELIMVIVILGILSAIAIPRLFDFSGDAKKAAVLGILGSVRTALSLYFTKNALPPPTGGSRPWWPNVTQVQNSDNGPGFVMESKMADNPFSENGNTSGRNDVAAGAAQTGRTSGILAANAGAWAYDEQGSGIPATGQPISDFTSGVTDVGQFWAFTSTSNVSEFNF
ncbi:MAG: type II secretion system protein [Planctomycetes bacterium]|nr:type II secretion system protein [Planctomycetota bacterium]